SWQHDLVVNPVTLWRFVPTELAADRRVSQRNLIDSCRLQPFTHGWSSFGNHLDVSHHVRLQMRIPFVSWASSVVTARTSTRIKKLWILADEKYHLFFVTGKSRSPVISHDVQSSRSSILADGVKHVQRVAVHCSREDVQVRSFHCSYVEKDVEGDIMPFDLDASQSAEDGRC